jgi:hypothetical protein
MYLRTYEHAGAAEVRLCGARVGVLDALWADFRSYRLSMTEPFHLLVPDLRAACADGVVVVEMSPRPPPALLGESVPAPAVGRERGAERVKIVSVRMCRV